jgi:hypothetical protein
VKAAIALDDWKLPVFRKRLTEAGYEYRDGGAFMNDTTLLTVITNDMLKLKRVIEACESECQKSKGTRNGD